MTLETDSMFITYLLAVYLNFSIVTYVGDKHLLPYGSVFFLLDAGMSETDQYLIVVLQGSSYSIKFVVLAMPEMELEIELTLELELCCFPHSNKLCMS